MTEHTSLSETSIMQLESFIGGKIGGYVETVRERGRGGARGKLRFDFDSFLMKANAGKFHFKSLHEKNVNVQWTNVVFVVALRVYVSVCVYVYVYILCVCRLQRGSHSSANATSFFGESQRRLLPAMHSGMKETRK